MRRAVLRRSRQSERLPGQVGVARLDRRTKNLLNRLRPGDIALIDHIDLDRAAAEALVAAGVAGVVNVAPSISGRYPNLGPEILVAAGVPVVDNAGADVFGAVREGDVVRLDEDTLYAHDGRVVAKGDRLTQDSVAAAMAEARAGLATQLEAFAANTTEFLRRERDLLLDGVGVPAVRTELADRHVLVVVRGPHHREDLHALRRYIREYRPVLVGVDGGADALWEQGYVPDLVVGDPEAVRDEVLTCGAEVVVHAYRDGRAPGLQRLQDLGVEPVVFAAAGTSEDIALLLADATGASLIVAAGTHATLEEFLDKGRSGMASTFLTRLRVGGKLVDAEAVSRLYRSRIKLSTLVALVAATVVTFVVAFLVTTGGQLYLAVYADRWDSFVHWIQRLL